MSEAFRLRASPESLEVDLLWEHGCQGLMQDGDEVVAYFPDRIPLPLTGSWETIQDIDYVKQYFDTLEPIVLEHLIIAPTHKSIKATEKQNIIWLDPGMAFGTGHHETTFMALETLETLKLKNKTVLDVGTGSGILAMAAQLLGSPKVTGIDIDPQAVIVARDNAKLNQLELELYEGTIEGQSDHSTDMIVANLFAELHILLANHYARVLKPGGTLIITGILSEKSPMVLEALKTFTLQETKTKGEWTLFRLVSKKLVAIMRIHRVFIPNLQEGILTLTGQEAHHLLKVLRVSMGQPIKAFDGKGLESVAIIQTVNDFEITLAVQTPEVSPVEASITITLAIALLKGDKLSDIIRQATELGVIAIRPFISQHCEVRELSENKLERLRRIAQEAAKQSGRSVVPIVHEAIKLETLPLSPLTLVAHPYTSGTFKDISTPLNDLTLITGPEGGLSNPEIERLVQKGATAIRLGPRILRAETAPIALIASILLPEAL